MALSNPCVQYKSTKYGFGSHFEQTQKNSASVLGANVGTRSFSTEESGRPYKVHPRGYNDYTDVPYFIFHEINTAMMACHSCPDYAHVFQKYTDYLTDTQIGYAFQDISENNYIRTPEYWNVIVPRVKEQVPYLDRQCTQALMMIITGAGEAQLQDNELWEALESKLVDEGLLRYFSLHESAEILFYFARCGRGSDELIDSLEKNFIKHRKALAKMPDTVDLCKEGFG